MALGVLAGLAAGGVRIGAEFHLVGFDGIAEFGRTSAATMLRWLETGERPPPVLRSPVELIARQSSGG